MWRILQLWNNMQLQSHQPLGAISKPRGFEATPAYIAEFKTFTRFFSKNSPVLKSAIGYTLIEILVALTVISLIFTFGYAGFREFSQRQALESAARSLQGNLRLVQEYALSGKKPDDCLVLDGYRVKISPNSYTLVAICAEEETSINKDNLPIANGITASVSINNFTFKVLGQGTSIPAGSASMITLTQAGTGKTRTITITAGGEIK